MSLRVWLPLNGDLHNQGLDTAVFTKAANVWGIGKIGAQALLTSTGTGNVMVNSLKDKKEFSIAYWVKVDSNLTFSNWQDIWAVQYTNGTGTYVMRDEHTSTAGNHQLLMAKETNVGGNTNAYLPMAIANAPNTWQHIVLVKGLTQTKSYLNGTIKQTRNNTDFETSNGHLTGNVAIGASTCGAYLNDFRIYDHCLSDEEINNIANGLVLHYELSGENGGSRNLLRIGTGAFHNTNQLTTITWSGWDQYDSLALTDIDWNSHYGDQITYSCYMENVQQTSGTGTGIMLHFRYADGTYQQFGGGKNGTSGQYLAAGESGWLRLTVTIPNAAARSSPTTISYVQASVRHNSSSGASTIKYQYPKVEFGSQQTAWALAPEDGGPDYTRIVDSSGYGHHGSIMNTCLYSADSARYNTSMHLVNGNSAINCGRGGMVTDSITVNLWLKSSSWANPVSCTESGGWNFESSGDYFHFVVYIAGVGYKYGASTTKRSVLCNNQWHMLTGVYDRINGHIKIYVDGELDNDFNAETTGAIGYHGGNVVWIGAEASGSSTAFASNGMAGLFSDFRIYCTALLDTEIKKLYNVSMGIDNKNNIHTNDFNELNEGPNLNKEAVVAGQINETIYCPYDPNIYIEPDGSKWVHIYHHNNPGAGSFSSTDSFTTNVYKDENRWFYVSLCNQITSWELMVKSKYTNTQVNENKYRWIQNVNPMVATYADVASDKVIKNTATGYASISWGGLYAKKGSAYLTTNNGNQGNWWGAVGSYSVYEGGIPGWGSTITTTGYNDLYVRVDNTEFVNAAVHYDIDWLAHQAIER